MIQLAIPTGFEFVAFTWDCVPPALAHAGRYLAQDASVAKSRQSYLPVSCIEAHPQEEDVERWDGLS